MKVINLVGDRFKERPSEASVDSHALMLRGGYMKFVGSGLYSQLPPLKRICQKIERVIREEMDAIDGQEVLFPVVMPAALWQESGRYISVGAELARFEDRSGTPMVLGMTHEEAAVSLVREYGQTYTRYPFMVYQIQTKFRDEPRPRAGLIRVREFTMKDAYSFHTSQEDLEAYYARAHEAYESIYKRCGLPQVISVASDSGMMGGKVAHEFMLLTPIGEDSIAVCSCGYSANVEAAPAIFENTATGAVERELVDTPHIATIEDICKRFKVGFAQTCKAVVYQERGTLKYVVVFLRGDVEANETKIRNFLKTEIFPAAIDENSPLFAGSIGPVNLPENVTALYDSSLKGLENLICGANVSEKHFTGVSLSRDVGNVEYGDFAKAQSGGICPKCGQTTLAIERGIEVGNIFQLGTKYSESMNMRYSAQDGSLQTPIMGCYGIGVGRLAASVCEVSRDDYGPIWPISIAPWEVELVCLRPDDAETHAVADELYSELQAAGLEVIYDDRAMSAGAVFAEADLLGCPVRLVISPKNLKADALELVTRDKIVKTTVTRENAVSETAQLVVKLYTEIHGK
ncbi:MAG: proline--tRNA ligase [Oscillospiraceae bacterium]|jgi:prolyl-tRNA synthetase|nr:proline--tRNA ligase [Oscillospiraceae bacterium]